MALKRFENEAIAKRIIRFYKNIANRDKRQTVRHFSAEGQLRNTIYGVLRRFNKSGKEEYKITGGPRTVSTPGVTKKVVKELVNKQTSVRECAVRHCLHPSTVQNIKSRENIKTLKCRKAPRYVNDQENRAQTNSRKVIRLATKKIIVMDDETFVPIDPKNIDLKKFYNFDDKTKVPDNVRFMGKEKKMKKYLVWQAIDQFGHVSKPYVKFGSLGSDEYRTECLAKRLLPFLKSKYNLSDIIFWPDMASIHYETDVQNWFKSKGIQCVKRGDNTPNCPQLRPIEKFWGLCKKEYSKIDTVSESTEEMRKHWIKLSKKVSQRHGMALMSSVRKNLRLVGKDGVYAPYKS